MPRSIARSATRLLHGALARPCPSAKPKYLEKLWKTPVSKRDPIKLDPTKLAASELRKLPIVDTSKPVQGKRRQQNSNAFKEFLRREARRTQKALNAVTHGKHIFVYQHVRTKQVVYSLTRLLDEKNVLSQMVNHGKKTVPATLRRDMWTPYYSVHFGDARLGLRAYQLLREFSMQRQLDPPKEMITVTEKYLASKRPKEAVEAEEYDENNKRRIGQIMNKKERARVLMNQTATSVADIAAVLAIQEEEVENGFLEGYAGKRGYLTPKARRNRRENFKRQAAKAKENATRIADLEKRLRCQIAQDDGAYPADIDWVKVLWRDIHDAHYAKSWPDSVQHGELMLEKSHVILSEKLLANGEYVSREGKIEQEEESKDRTEKDEPKEKIEVKE